MSREPADAIWAEISGDRARDIATTMTQFARPPGSSGYHAATNLIEHTLRALGIDDIVRHEYPLDGRTLAGGTPLPLAWEPGSARVRVVAPVELDVVDSNDVSSTLAWWSTPTPAGGATAELVGVGTGESDADFDGVEVAGKVVLIDHTERPSGWTHAAQLAIDRGAIGLLSDYLFYELAPHRTRESLPNAVQLLRLANGDGASNVWGCGISKTTADRLRDLLAIGSVTVHAEVTSQLFEGTGVNLISSIEGREPLDDAVFFVAHCSAGTRPGANCASGPALMVEIQRTLASLIDSGQLERPRRSIRFLHLIEGLGSRVFFDQFPDARRTVKVAYVFDSVGHDQAKLDSSLLYYRAPDSLGSFVNDHYASVMARLPSDRTWVFGKSTKLSSIRFEEAPYTPWSDNHYWAAMGVPSPLLMSWPDRYFHTQLLSADNLDPAVFRTAGAASGVAAYEIANADSASVVVMADELHARATERLRSLARRQDRRRFVSSPKHRPSEERSGDDRSHLRYVAERDSRALESLTNLGAGPETDAVQARLAVLTEAIRRVADDLGAGADVSPLRPDPMPGSDGLSNDTVLHRARDLEVASALDGLDYQELRVLADRLTAADANIVFDSLRPIGDEFWNLIDGRRTIAEICRDIRFEFALGVTPAAGLELGRGLLRAGLVVTDR